MTNPYIDQLKAKWLKLKAEIYEKRAAAQLDEQWQDLRAKQTELETELEKLKEQGETAAQETQEKLEQYLKDIQSTWNTILEKLKS